MSGSQLDKNENIIYDTGSRDLSLIEEEKNKDYETTKKQPCFCSFIKGILLFFLLLIFHFLCFAVTISIGLGVGILAGIFHEICWDAKISPFWEIYVTLVMIAIVVEIFFRISVNSSIVRLIDKYQKRYFVQLYIIPRIIYTVGYVGATVLLFFAYYGAHVMKELKSQGLNMTKLGGEPENPITLSSSVREEDHHSLIFFICLSFMIFTMSKENDWLTHRKYIMAQMHEDPAARGGVGNFALFFLTHVMMSFVYVLPLVGSCFLSRQFKMSAIVTYAVTGLMACIVGIGAVFIERRYPFPVIPMDAPSYSYENHLRIRMGLFQLWLFPIAAGRYFNRNRAVELNAQNDDFLIFTIEVSIGLVQAIKIQGNNFLLLRSIFSQKRLRPIPSGVYVETTESIVGILENNEEKNETGVVDVDSIVSITESTQTGEVRESEWSFSEEPQKISSFDSYEKSEEIIELDSLNDEDSEEMLISSPTHETEREKIEDEN